MMRRRDARYYAGLLYEDNEELSAAYKKQEATRILESPVFWSVLRDIEREAAYNWFRRAVGKEDAMAQRGILLACEKLQVRLQALSNLRTSAPEAEEIK